MVNAHDGGGGSGGYAQHTQRALMALIGSTTLTNIRAARNMWEDTALRASTIADLIEERLNALTSDKGGWTGPGAEAFSALVRKDLVDNLRAYALRAAGVSSKGNANSGYAADLKPVEQQIEASYSTATHNNIPWDVDTQWRVDQEVPDQGLGSKIEEAVTGKDEDYEEKKKKAPYNILNGANSTLKKVPQPEWDSLTDAIGLTPPPEVFSKTEVPVNVLVHRFDRLMEAQDMNSGVKSSVSTATNDVHAKLAAYSPQKAEEFTFTGGKLANGEQVTDSKAGGPPPNGGQTPAPGPGTPGPGTPGPGDPGPGNPGPGTPGPGNPGPGTPGPDPTNPHPPGPAPTNPGGPGTPGPGTPGDPGPGVPDPTDPTVPNPGDGGDGPGGYREPGTGGAGATPAPGAPAPSVPGGGIGSPGVGGPAPSPTVGTGPGAPGVGGMGALGGGGPMAAGGAGASFQVGPNGKPMVNPGNVGPVAGPNGASPGGGAGAGAGGAGGTGAAGAPMGQRRGQGNDEEEKGEEIDGTWLEEDESVWGSRAGAPPAEIR